MQKITPFVTPPKPCKQRPELEDPSITYKKSKSVSFEEFLSTNAPNQVTKPRKFWITVNKPGTTPAKVDDDLVATVQALWKKMANESKDLDENNIRELATSCSYTRGKWLIYRRAHTVNETWEKVAHAVLEGILGSSARVSTKTSADSNKEHKYIICVYTDDYTNQGDAMRVAQELRNLGIRGTFTYKPDIYVSLGIYFHNPWKISPTIYVARDPFRKEEQTEEIVVESEAKCCPCRATPLEEVSGEELQTT